MKKDFNVVRFSLNNISKDYKTKKAHDFSSSASPAISFKQQQTLWLQTTAVNNTLVYIQYSSHVVNVFFYDIPTIDLSVV